MKYLFVLLVALFITASLNAQVHVNVNLDLQPIWGPVGNDYVEYYYLPDIDAYYYVPQHRFYFNEGGHWRGRSSLPARYRDFDLFHAHKVVINEKDPWRNHESYREKYSSLKGLHDQVPIRDSRDSKYFVNKDHPEHNKWVQQQKHDKGNHNGWNKGNKKENDNGNRKDKDNK